MKGRIKVGAIVFQDFAAKSWPVIRNKSRVDPDIVFDISWKEGINFWECKADGFGYSNKEGERGDYGNGSVFVHNKDDVEVVETIYVSSQIENKVSVFGGHWQHSNGVLVCGGVRIAREDFDTQPTDSVRKEIFDWICNTLNKAQWL